MGQPLNSFYYGDNLGSTELSEVQHYLAIHRDDSADQSIAAAQERSSLRSSSCAEEVVHFNADFTESGAQRALFDVAGVVREGDLAAALRVAPDFVIPGALTVEDVPKVRSS